MKHRSHKLARPWIVFVSLAGLMWTLMSAQPCAAQAGGKKLKQPDLLENFSKLTPAERLKTLSPLLKKNDLIAVERGLVASEVVERATLDAAKVSDIVSRTRWLDKTPTTIVKWVIDDGSVVAKGDKVIEFDPTPYTEALREQKAHTAATEAKLRAATEQFNRIQRDTGIDIKLAEIDVKLAELALAQVKGTDETQRQVLRLHVDKASLLLERVKLQADQRIEKSKTEQAARKVLNDRELAKQREIEIDLESCVMRTPQDGLVVYYIPEQIRGPGGAGILAVGEPMREGQKLLRICDLGQMLAVARVPESMISRLKVGQKAQVRVDAFPQRSFEGKVTHVANVADQAAFFRNDVKVYRVHIAIDGAQDALRPGMSASTTIELAKVVEALRVPATAIVSRGKSSYCLVQIEKEIHVREVKTGVAGSAFVEVTAGLKEGERVLRDPYIVLRLLEGSTRP